MIIQYHRPETIENALSLLRKPNTLPLGGGTLINTPAFLVPDATIVDLQGLGLTRILKRGKNLEIDACVTLQQLLESEYTSLSLKNSIRHEAAVNIRNMATIAGSLVSCSGRSPLATMMLALDAELSGFDYSSKGGPEQTKISLGDYLPLRPSMLITKVKLPVNAITAYEQVARTPGDKPIICVALARWPSGRTRLALGGWGASPTLAMDGNDPAGSEAAARNAAHAANDPWGSAEYRAATAEILVRRCVLNLGDLENTR
ncbi:MAG: FAD binding domain-containing protein [Chloroflexota bacterium]